MAALCLWLLFSCILLFFSILSAQSWAKQVFDSDSFIEYLKKNPKALDEYIHSSIERFIQKQQQDAEKTRQQQQEIAIEQARNILNLKNNDHIRGKKNAEFLMIEYSDFQCPFCKRFHSTASQFVAQNSDVAWIFRHFPLPSHEPLASQQALAAECVAKIKGNDAFWQANDLIFKTNPNNFEKIAQMAEKVGIEQEEFLNCFENKEQIKIIADGIFKDLKEGESAGVKGTPGVFLIHRASGNTKIIPGAVSIKYLKNALDELKKSSQ